jgi:hypothetical protein
MPTKYSDRLNIPVQGSNLQLFTRNGLEIATTYNKIVLTKKGPYIQFKEEHLNKNNIIVLENQKWRINHFSSPYAEYRSKDSCCVRIIFQKQETEELESGFWYISAFDLTSKNYPVLISSLKRERKLQVPKNFYTRI